VTPDNFHVNASYHPQFAAPGPFLKKLAVLRDRGFEPGVLVVSHPSFLQDLPALRKAFRAEGHPFTTLVFRGEYNGKPYPESFTPEEKAVVSETIAQEGAQRASYKRFQLDRDDTLGRLCYTGSVYGNVKPTGEVYRCGRDQTALKPIGNIFDPDFRMDPAPTACPFKNCSCQEYIYVAEEYEPWLAARGEKRVVA
jgi:MoaA/NifB/PqqE/SkfB family radical SAM enzyme